MIDEYTLLFQRQGYHRFEKLIDESNEIMINPNFKEKVNEVLYSFHSNETYSIKELKKLEEAINKEFSPIIVNQY
ncbi:hypothetical protein ACQKDP_12125 [Psychrobacter pacificensis]|uniref:hypothetical protein n=1 Tax=Psychrobacter pacificensis TaxID=112002 RepID=UPI003CFFD901